MMLSVFDFLSEFIKQGTTFSLVLAILGLLAVIILMSKVVIPSENRTLFIKICIFFAVFGIVWEIFFSNRRAGDFADSNRPVTVAPDEVVGLYKGSIQSLKATNFDIKPILYKKDGYKMDVLSDLNCKLYCEDDTTEISLGNIPTMSNPVSSILIPKLGWAICEKSNGLITLRSDELKNENYYFKLSKNEKK